MQAHAPTHAKPMPTHLHTGPHAQTDMHTRTHRSTRAQMHTLTAFTSSSWPHIFAVTVDVATS